MKSHLRILGDIHGLHKQYLSIIRKAKYSVQLGDFGFNYDVLNEVDSTRHRIVAGNHDCYDDIGKYPHFLGDYGYIKLGDVKFFFIRGGFSLDKEYRLKMEYAGGLKTWWPEEELSYKVGLEAIRCYKTIKPDIVFSHECPNDIAKMIGNPDILRYFGYNPDTFKTSTQVLLQSCFDEWQPKLWFYGHFHWNKVLYNRNTRFQCLNELSYVDLDDKGNIV